MVNTHLFDYFPSLTTFSTDNCKILLPSHSNINELSLSYSMYSPPSRTPPLHWPSLHTLSVAGYGPPIDYSSLPSSSLPFALHLQVAYFPSHLFSLLFNKYNNIVILHCDLYSHECSLRSSDLIPSLSLLPHLAFLWLRWGAEGDWFSDSLMHQLFSHLPPHLITLHLTPYCLRAPPPIELDWNQCQCPHLQLLSFNLLFNTTIRTERNGEGLFRILSYFNRLFPSLKGIYSLYKLFLFPLDREKKVIKYKEKLSDYGLFTDMCYSKRNMLLGEGEGEGEGKVKSTEQLKYSFNQLLEFETNKCPIKTIEINEIDAEWLKRADIY